MEGLPAVVLLPWVEPSVFIVKRTVRCRMCGGLSLGMLLKA